MAENVKEASIEFTEEDFYRGAIIPRVASLLEILEEILPGHEISEQIGDNNLPFIRVVIDDDVIDLKYFSVGEPDEGRYILILQSKVLSFDEDDNGNVLECEAFNMGSPFGFAVYDPADRCIEYRAQVPEVSGMLSYEHYENLIALFLYGISELRESVEG